MHNAKRTRPGSQYNADNQPAKIDFNNYLFKTFPPESPVQPGNLVQYMDEDGQMLTGTVLPEGAFLTQDVIYVCVDFGENGIEAVAAELLTKMFDYAALDAETRIVVQQKTGEIKERMRRAAQDIIDIGAKLIEVKANLQHGQFEKWLSAEFNWTDRTARNFMHVATAFKTENFSDLNFGPSALYLLAAPSTPEEARNEAIQRAGEGEYISHNKAKSIVADHKPAPAVTRPPETVVPKAAYDQAQQAFPPVSRPPATTYTNVEDDFVDDVPSIEVDNEYTEEEKDWLDGALAGKGIVPDAKSATVSQIQSDLDQVKDDEARQRLTAIVAQHEADARDRAQRKANWLEHERLRLLAAQTPPPEGQYRTIVIDPPWPMKKIERGVRPNQGTYLDYPTMQLADIYNLGIEPLAAEDGCHLYLWTTHKFLPEALRITTRWGFRYNCLLTWEKTTGMTPYHFRFNTELVIFATRGSMAVQRKGLPLCFRGEASGHSTKPDTFYEMAALASPGPRLEMFARQPREGWKVWGNEVNDARSAAD